MRNIDNLYQAYKEYVTTMIRRYVHNIPSITQSEEKAFEIVDECYKTLNAADKKIIDYVFGRCDSIADNILEYSLATSYTDDDIWTIVKRFEKEVAVKRGLI